MYRRMVVLAIAIAISGCNGLRMPDVRLELNPHDETCQCDECLLLPLKEPTP